MSLKPDDLAQVILDSIDDDEPPTALYTLNIHEARMLAHAVLNVVQAAAHVGSVSDEAEIAASEAYAQGVGERPFSQRMRAAITAAIAVAATPCGGRARQQRPQDAGEHVAGPGRGEPRHVRRDGADAAVRRRHDRRRALQQHDGTGGRRRLGRRRDPVGLLAEAETLPQRRVLPVVRSEHPRRAHVGGGRPGIRGAIGARQRLDEVQGAGVDDHGDIRLQDAAERGRLVGGAVRGIRPRSDYPRLHATVGGDGLGAAVQHEVGGATGPEVANHADTGAPRRLDAEHRCARVPVRSGSHPQHPTGILVVGAGWLRQDARSVVRRPRAHHGVTLPRPRALTAGETMSLLFTPIDVHGVTVRNRLWVAPMCQYSAADGVPNDWHHVHLAQFASGGAGVVIAEATAVVPEGRISPDDTGLWNDEQRDAWAPITAAIEARGAVPAVQLAHAGRKASSAE